MHWQSLTTTTGGNDNVTFQDQLITLRKHQGLSQEQLGAKLGVTRQTVSKWELGITTPELDKLMLLADLFHISIDELVGRGTKAESEEGHTRAGEETPPVKKIHYIPYPWHYEYKSRRTLFGLPLVHVNIGRWIPGQKRCHAKGIIAVGNIASGILALGGIASGIFSLGGISAGLFSLGGLSVGLLLAVGGFSVGTLAVGGLALGIFAVGGGAFGIYAIGGAAVAQKIAAGGAAQAAIAIGDAVNGDIVFDINSPVSPAVIQEAILTKFPGTWDIIVKIFSHTI